MAQMIAVKYQREYYDIERGNSSWVTPTGKGVYSWASGFFLAVCVLGNQESYTDLSFNSPLLNTTRSHTWSRLGVLPVGKADVGVLDRYE